MGQATSTRPRIVLSAYQCAPGQGSVSQIGWEWASRLAGLVELTVVTHVRNREHLEATDLPQRARLHYIDTEWFAGPMYRLGKWLFPGSEHASFMVAQVDFYLYDWLVSRWARRELQGATPPQLVHAVTPVSHAAASWAARLPIPFVWGPLNSGLRTPEGFRGLLSDEAGWAYRVQRLTELPDRLIGCQRRATAVLAATEATRRALVRVSDERLVRFMDIGVDLERFTSTPWPRLQPKDTLELLFVGRLVPVKALGVLLDALEAVDDDFPWRLTVVGDGPMRQRWEQQAKGLGERVRFRGWVPFEEIAANYRDCHAVVLPSIRESGGGVLLEAMASGRPVIGVDFGGPGEIISDEVGRKLAVMGPEQLSRDLEATLRDIREHPDSWRERAEAAAQAARAVHDWQARAGQMLGIYQRLIRNEESTDVS